MGPVNTVTPILTDTQIVGAILLCWSAVVALLVRHEIPGWLARRSVGGRE